MKKVVTIRVNKNELNTLKQKAQSLSCTLRELAEIYLYNDELVGEPDLVSFRSSSIVFGLTKETFDTLKKESNKTGIPCAVIIRSSFFGPKRRLASTSNVHRDVIK